MTHRWRAYAVIVLVLAAGGWLIVGAARSHGLFGAETASWAQAVFSVIAILAGFGAARDQIGAAHAENLALAREQDRTARAAALSLTTVASETLDSVLARLEDPAPLDGAAIQRLKRAVEYQREVIAGFPLASLKAEALMRAFAPMAGTLDSAADDLRTIADTTLDGRAAAPAFVAQIRARMAPLRETASANHERLRTLVASQDAGLRG